MYLGDAFHKLISKAMEDIMQSTAAADLESYWMPFTANRQEIAARTEAVRQSRRGA
jgi:hypothetical protein